MKITLILDDVKYGTELDRKPPYLDARNFSARIAELVEETVLIHLGSVKSLPRIEKMEER